MFNCSTTQREEQWKNLNDFTKKIHEEIMETISSLGWTMESIENDNDNSLLCPYNSSHRIGKRILDQHLESCQWKQEGYNEFDLQLPESGSSLNSYSSVKLDSTMQNNILLEAKRKNSDMKIESYECPTWHNLYHSSLYTFLSKHEFLTLMIGLGERLIPRTSDRIFTDFTRDERTVLYDYVVSNTMKTDIGHDITDIQKLQNAQGKEDKGLSFLDLLIQERNLKRRRAKHRGVHTNRKSHTEIRREVIHQQMELYIDYLTETCSTNQNMRTSGTYENQGFDRNHDDMKSRTESLNELPSKRRNNLFVEDSSECYERSKSRGAQEYKSFDKSYGSNGNYSEHRDKYARVTADRWETQKPHKHKRSRSKEREHGDKKSKHGSMRTHYGRKGCKVKGKREITE